MSLDTVADFPASCVPVRPAVAKGEASITSPLWAELKISQGLDQNMTKENNWNLFF